MSDYLNCDNVHKFRNRGWLYAMHKNKPIKFRAEHYKFIVWGILQRLEALGYYNAGQITLYRDSSLRKIIKAALWLEEEMGLRQLDKNRGK
jgi:hypothetical protein